MFNWIKPWMVGLLGALALLAMVFALIGIGKHLEKGNQAAELVEAVNKAREDEAALTNAINASTSQYINDLQKQARKANAQPKITLVNDCRVPAAIGRLLNDAQQSVRDDASIIPGRRSAATEVDSTCAAELDIAKRNYGEVCIPNAMKLEKLQRDWELVRDAVNGTK